MLVGGWGGGGDKACELDRKRGRDSERGGEGGMFGELLILRLFLQPSAVSRIDLSSEKFKREIAGMLQTIYFAVAIRAFTKGIPSGKERSSSTRFST